MFQKVAVVVAMLAVSIVSAQAGDLKPYAKYLLPPGQTETEVIEWESYDGDIFVEGNVIKVRLRFDQVAVDTFNYIPPGIEEVSSQWGLELDIVECNDNPVMKLDDIRYTPNLNVAKPIQDTEAFDWLTDDKCEDAGGNKVRASGFTLLIRDASKLQAETDYYVEFVLKNPIPDSGTTLGLNLQLVWDVNTKVFGVPVFTELSGYLDRYDYYSVETSFYRKFFVGRDSREKGICWAQKAIGGYTGFPCSPNLQCVP